MTRLARFALEVDVEAEPLMGSLETEGTKRDFVGWLGLIAAIEAALDRVEEEND